MTIIGVHLKRPSTFGLLLTVGLTGCSLLLLFGFCAVMGVSPHPLSIGALAFAAIWGGVANAIGIEALSGWRHALLFFVPLTMASPILYLALV